MSDANFSGAFKRFLKGDLDPINIFGINPTKQELKDNRADRERRASQIEFEKNNEALKKAGGSVDDPTRQVKKLKSKTNFMSLSPFAPAGPLARTVGILTEAGAKKKTADSKAKKLNKKNEAHAASQGSPIRSLGILGAKKKWR